jgi:hypothetical protein
LSKGEEHLSNTTRDQWTQPFRGAGFLLRESTWLKLIACFNVPTLHGLVYVLKLIGSHLQFRSLFSKHILSLSSQGQCSLGANAGWGLRDNWMYLRAFDRITTLLEKCTEVASLGTIELASPLSGKPCVVPSPTSFSSISLSAANSASEGVSSSCVISTQYRHDI